MAKRKGIIILHQFPRTKTAPSPSPYPVKLETFLRMNKLPYEPDFKKPIGSKGKSPWITDDDGEELSDSQFVIEHLMRKHNIQMLKLTPEEKVIERGLRAILEDNLYFVMMAENAIHCDHNLQLRQFPRLVPRAAPDFLQTFVIKQIRKKIKKIALMQGSGLHTREDLHYIGLNNLECLSTYLGSKPYLMGNAPSVIDCVAFGFLVMLLYGFPPDYFFRKECERRFPNLRSYVERIKKTYWPDWEELLAKD